MHMGIFQLFESFLFLCLHITVICIILICLFDYFCCLHNFFRLLTYICSLYHCYWLDYLLLFFASLLFVCLSIVILCIIIMCLLNCCYSLHHYYLFAYLLLFFASLLFVCLPITITCIIFISFTTYCSCLHHFHWFVCLNCSFYLNFARFSSFLLYYGP